MSDGARVGRTVDAFARFEAHQRELARLVELDQRDGDNLYEAVERAARAVVMAPAVTPCDVRRKIDVLRRWYFADLFGEPSLCDDAAASALRHVIGDVLAHLPGADGRA